MVRHVLVCVICCRVDKPSLWCCWVGCVVVGVVVFRYLDGKLVFSLTAETLSVTGARIPEEPM